MVLRGSFYIKNKLHLFLFSWNTLSVSSWITRTSPHFQLLVASRRSESKSSTKEGREQRKQRELQISLWCWCPAQSKLSRPTSSTIDFIYFFENFSLLFRITFVDSVPDMKACIFWNNFVLKQFPYLTLTHHPPLLNYLMISVIIYHCKNLTIYT